MEKVDWKVEGMDCTNCALTINRYLQKEGMQSVKVNFIGGEVSFELNGNKTKDELTKGINDLGYKVVNEQPTGSGGQTTNNKQQTTNHKQFSQTTSNASSSVFPLLWF